MSDKPSFKALFEEYATVYDKHDLDALAPYLSPNIEVHFKGQKVASGYGEEMKKHYTDHWARPNCKVTFKEIIELPEENGVQVKVIDHAENKLMTAKYLFANENGKWLQVKHDVLEREDYTE